MSMTENQEIKIAKQEIKSTDLGKQLLDKFSPKKDLNRKATSLAERVLSLKTLERFSNCGSFMHFFTS